MKSKRCRPSITAQYVVVLSSVALRHRRISKRKPPKLRVDFGAAFLCPLLASCVRRWSAGVSCSVFPNGGWADQQSSGATLYMILYGKSCEPAKCAHCAYHVFNNLHFFNIWTDSDSDSRLQNRMPRGCNRPLRQFRLITGVFLRRAAAKRLLARFPRGAFLVPSRRSFQPVPLGLRKCLSSVTESLRPAKRYGVQSSKSRRRLAFCISSSPRRKPDVPFKPNILFSSAQNGAPTADRGHTGGTLSKGPLSLPPRNSANPSAEGNGPLSGRGAPFASVRR